MIRFGLAKFLDLVRLSAWVLLPLATFLRLTWRDEVPGIALLFYAAPWPVIGVGCLVLSELEWRRGGRKSAIITAVLGLVAGGLWLHGSWKTGEPPAKRGDLRVVLWNVARPDARLPEAAAWLRSQDADIIALAEARRRGKPHHLDRWLAELPGYKPLLSYGEMLCLVRGEILESNKGWLITSPSQKMGASSYRTDVEALIRGEKVHIVQVDLDARPFYNREIPLRALHQHAQTLRGKNLIVLGDFNTPRESAFFDPLRGELSQAFEAAGTGFAETWPRPFPVLSLDQIWTSPSLRAVRCQHHTSWLTDHRAVVAEFDFVR